MDLETVMQLISNYGLALVVSGVFLYLIIRLINLLINYLSDKVGKKKHDKTLEARNTASVQIQSLISNFILDTDCTRVQVIEFSNTVMSVAYLPFKYMTCTYEVYRFGEKPMSHAIDHLSTSLFTPFFEELESRDYCIFDIDDKNHRMGGAMYDIAIQENCSKFMGTMLKNTKGKFIGFLMMVRDKDEEFQVGDSDKLQKLGANISALLSVMDK